MTTLLQSLALAVVLTGSFGSVAQAEQRGGPHSGGYRPLSPAEHVQMNDDCAAPSAPCGW